jgi:hypothetical protein
MVSGLSTVSVAAVEATPAGAASLVKTASNSSSFSLPLALVL